MSNAGEDLLKMLMKAAWWVIKLLPDLFKLIYRGIVAIVNRFKKTD